jgi:hypothetical protein
VFASVIEKQSFAVCENKNKTKKKVSENCFKLFMLLCLCAALISCQKAGFILLCIWKATSLTLKGFEYWRETNSEVKVKTCVGLQCLILCTFKKIQYVGTLLKNF